MVIAERGRSRIKVSRSAFDTIFWKKGYRVVKDEADVREEKSDEQKQQEVSEAVSEAEKEESQESEDALDEIPISDMNKQQLSEYAKKHNIDTSSASSVAQARKIIQREVRNRNMQ